MTRIGAPIVDLRLTSPGFLSHILSYLTFQTSLCDNVVYDAKQCFARPYTDLLVMLAVQNGKKQVYLLRCGETPYWYSFQCGCKNLGPSHESLSTAKVFGKISSARVYDST